MLRPTAATSLAPQGLTQGRQPASQPASRPRRARPAVPGPPCQAASPAVRARRCARAAVAARVPARLAPSRALPAAPCVPASAVLAPPGHCARASLRSPRSPAAQPRRRPAVPAAGCSARRARSVAPAGCLPCRARARVLGLAVLAPLCLRQSAWRIVPTPSCAAPRAAPSRSCQVLGPVVLCLPRRATVLALPWPPGRPRRFVRLAVSAPGRLRRCTARSGSFDPRSTNRARSGQRVADSLR